MRIPTEWRFRFPTAVAGSRRFDLGRGRGTGTFRCPRFLDSLRSLGMTLALAGGVACGGSAQEVSGAATASGPYESPPLTAVRLTEGSFWAERLGRNRDTTIPHILAQNEKTGRVANFERAAGRRDGAYEGRRFNDTDVYKVIEAASYALAVEPDPKLDAELDRLIDLIAASQEADGYLMPARTIDPDRPAAGLGARRWMHEAAGSHELYNAGHLIEAGVAHHQATGKRTLLEVALRLADRIDADFGQDARQDAPGHEEIELALLRLADLTGEGRYRELARFFVEQRGREHDGEPYPADTPFAIYNDRRYRQDHVPVAEQTEALGHAVRATYLYAAMAGLAAGDEARGGAGAGVAAVLPYAAPLESIWRDLVSTKLYLTGGIGSRDRFESFGEPYELPNRTAYTETCAAIGNELWQHATFLRTGRAEPLDVLERALYNGVLSGVSQRGDSFFYTNPLESAGDVERSVYFEVACCPANLARTLARLPELLYAVRGDEVAVALYAANSAELVLEDASSQQERHVRIEQRTDYPWGGTVRLEVFPEPPGSFTLALRIPGWAREQPVPSELYRFADEAAEAPRVRVTRVGEEPLEVDATTGMAKVVGAAGPRIWFADDGFTRIRRAWRAGDVVELVLPMPVRTVIAAPQVEADAGRVALQRGPLVYAVEAADNGGAVLDLRVPPDTRFDAVVRTDLLGGVVTVVGEAARAGGDGSLEPHRLVAVPYFAWANRGPGEMAVWLPAVPDTKPRDAKPR